MLEPFPIELSRRYENELKQRGIATQLWAPYTKWLRYYWDFCHKYDYPPNARQSFPPFAAKLRSKRQSDVQRKQAQQAISLYYAFVAPDLRGGTEPPGESAVQHSNQAPAADADASHPLKKIVMSAPAVDPIHRTPPDKRQDQKPGQSQDSLQRNLRESHVAGVQPPRATGERLIVPAEQTISRPAASSKWTGASWVAVYDRLHAAIKNGGNRGIECLFMGPA